MAADGHSLPVLKTSQNGWGALFVPPNGQRLSFRSQVPCDILDKLVVSKAFIFWLEMLAQVLAVASVAPWVSTHVVCFCDNSAAEHALRKGYSKNEHFTRILSCLWSWIADKGISLSFHRVPSKENCSDSVSRGDWDFADKHGFFRMELDYQPFYGWLQSKQETQLEDLIGSFADLADQLTAHQSGRQRAEVV